MFSIAITEKGGKTSVREFDQGEVTIGRVQGNDIMLPKSNISKRHARIVSKNGSFVVIDTKSTNGTYINGKRINAPYDLADGDKIFVGDFTLEVQVTQDGRGAAAPSAPAGSSRSEVVGAEGSGSGLRDDDWAGDGDLEADWGDDEWGMAGAAEEVDQLAEADLIAEPANPPPTRPQVRDEAPADGPAERRKPVAEPDPAPEAAPMERGKAQRPSQGRRPVAAVSPSAARSPMGMALAAMHQHLTALLKPRPGVAVASDVLRKKTADAVKQAVAAVEGKGQLPKGVASDALLQAAIAESVGFGPLEELVGEAAVTAVMVNHADQVFVERDGVLQAVDCQFSCDHAIVGLVERLLMRVGLVVEETGPVVDVGIGEGLHLTAMLPPVAIKGSTLTLRKTAAEPLLVDDLVAGGTLTADMAEFLEVCVRARRSIFVTGAARAGKTTVLNVLCSFVPSDERLVTVEHIAELFLEQEHVVQLEAQPPTSMAPGGVTVRDLLRTAMRLRADRIVVGECRGGETLDVLQAMNSGECVLTSVHAASPEDAVGRLQTLALLSGTDVPARGVRDLVARGVDVLVHVERQSDGLHRITHVAEAQPDGAGKLFLHDIFRFERGGAKGRGAGRFRATGVVPSFYEGLADLGIEVDPDIFKS